MASGCDETAPEWYYGAELAWGSAGQTFLAMSSSTLSSGPPTTTTSLRFSTGPSNGDRAYVHINADPVTGKQNKNTDTGDHEIVIENIRGQEHLYKLDTAGFQLGHHPANHKTFTNDVEVENEYYPESIDLIKKVTGASKVVLFDHSECNVSQRIPCSDHIWQLFAVVGLGKSIQTHKSDSRSPLRMSTKPKRLLSLEFIDIYPHPRLLPSSRNVFKSSTSGGP